MKRGGDRKIQFYYPEKNIALSGLYGLLPSFTDSGTGQENRSSEGLHKYRPPFARFSVELIRVRWRWL